jgi:hypothetical protein
MKLGCQSEEKRKLRSWLEGKEDASTAVNITALPLIHEPPTSVKILLPIKKKNSVMQTQAPILSRTWALSCRVGGCTQVLSYRRCNSVPNM